ncbi:Protein of unknown function [Pseudonocardia thermophila]|uniref:DUF3099 domain-containing protein n=1 Tax=Pseudonocardia thermophila TaxID=1848 RepID=A0A1M6NRS8_PSETH|nr:Protein of unknown function [Pseudonocardia thermophila]
MTDGRGIEDPVLITDAARSYEDELAIRKRRYKVMMAMRVPFMIAAAAFYQTPWLAVALIVLSIPLPWCAVLIANDRLPKKKEKPNRYRPERPELESREHPVIEAEPFDGGPIDGQPIDGERIGTEKPEQAGGRPPS